jgi:hypothetical protein
MWKITLELAQDLGLIPKVNCFEKIGLGDRFVDNKTFIRRREEIVSKYCDKNECREFVEDVIIKAIENKFKN